MLETVFPAIEALGIVAFGLSGFLVARRRCMDVYGTVVLALATALGGGTVRDLVLGIAPPVNLVSPLAIALGAGPALLLSLGPVDRVLRSARVRRIVPLSRSLLVADAIGLAAFTVSGVSTATRASDSVTLALFCGVLTATGGGMIRDLLAGVVPAVLRREIYAVASLAGAAIVVAAGPVGLSPVVGAVAGLVVTFAIRVGTWALGIHLPVPRGCDEKKVEL